MRNNGIFELDNTAAVDRLKLALEERNRRFQGPDRPFYNHARDLCCKKVENKDNADQIYTFIAISRHGAYYFKLALHSQPCLLQLKQHNESSKVCLE
jgi:hypothetical protein